jgi:hypothetical protein
MIITNAQINLLYLYKRIDLMIHRKIKNLVRFTLVEATWLMYNNFFNIKLISQTNNDKLLFPTESKYTDLLAPQDFQAFLSSF